MTNSMVIKYCFEDRFSISIQCENVASVNWVNFLNCIYNTLLLIKNHQ